MRSKYKRVAMKKKMARNKLIPHKQGNPPRQTRGARHIKRPEIIVSSVSSAKRKE